MGSLSGLEFSEFKHLSEKAKSDAGLSQGEGDRLRGLTTTSDSSGFVGSDNLARGRQRNAAQLLNLPGQAPVGSGEDDATSDLVTAVRERAKLSAKSAEKLANDTQKLLDLETRNQDKASANMDALISRQEKQEETLRRQEDALQAQKD